MAQYDLIIVGGGIGGAALAQVMAAAGRSVLLLEQSQTYEDRVRGEWIAPWGVDEVKRVGLYDLLVGAGGHHITRHVTFDGGIDPRRGPGAGPAAGHLSAGRARAAGPGASEALPDPVRRRHGRRGRGAAAACA